MYTEKVFYILVVKEVRGYFAALLTQKEDKAVFVIVTECYVLCRVIWLQINFFRCPKRHFTVATKFLHCYFVLTVSPI